MFDTVQLHYSTRGGRRLSIFTERLYLSEDTRLSLSLSLFPSMYDLRSLTLDIHIEEEELPFDLVQMYE